MSEPERCHLPPPTGTSASLLSNPALTDTQSNFPLPRSKAESSVGIEPAEEDEPQEGTDREDQVPGQSSATSST